MSERVPRRTPPVERAAMRERPSDEVLAWLTDALGAAAVSNVAVMPGGSTSALHRVTILNGRGAQRTVVLRRYVLNHILDENPMIANQEIAALQLAAEASVPTPELLVADPTGAQTGAPAVVMSCLPGTPMWQPRRRQHWIDQIVEALTVIHDVVIPAGVTLPSIAGYQQESWQPPRWAADRRVWERAIELFHGPVPDTDVTFVHRDFHPGNLLWHRDRLSGIVDWQAACRGPTSIDIGHFRLNTLFYEPGLGDELCSAWEYATGRRYHPWADVISIIGMLDDLRDAPPNTTARHAIDTTLAAAVDELAG